MASVDLVQVFDQRTVARRAEQQRTVVLPEGRVVGIDGDSVGRGFLHRERDVVTDAETLFVNGHLRSQQLLKSFDMFGRNREMNLRHAIRGRIDRPFDQMFLDRLARTFGIGVEGDESFGFAAVAESFVHDGADDRPVVCAGRKQGLQFGPEGELSDVFEQGVDPLAALAVVHELEKLLEHTRRGARRGHEFHNGQSGGGPLVTFGGGIGLGVAQRQHAVAG